MNISLFISSVLIWGTTWYAIALQLGDVPVIVSVFYRFALAGIVFVIALLITGRLKLPKKDQQAWIFLQALCLFSFNFILFYNATNYVSSGVVSVVFSLATIFNAINARILFKDVILPKTILAAAFGVLGLSLLFWTELSVSADISTLKGLGFACGGTMLFSLGNMVSRRNSSKGLTPITANAWGMVYGSCVLLAIIWLTGGHLVMPKGAIYWSALIYLAVIGSVVGFTTYLTLVARIGSSKAAYATVMFPIVALAISTLFEGYTWNPTNALGLVFALLGNIIMFLPNKQETA